MQSEAIMHWRTFRSHWLRTLSALRLGALVAAVSCVDSAPNEPPSPTRPADLPEDLLAACPDAKRELSSTRPCTAVGCSNGFWLRTSAQQAWPPGSYRFAIELDGDVTTCLGSLPLPACQTRGIRCDSDAVSITESGCALPASSHAFGDLHFIGFPRTVSVETFLDERLVARATYEPAYRSGQPNGPGCEPICCSASNDITLDFAATNP